MPVNGQGDKRKDEPLSTPLSPQDGDHVFRGQITSTHQHQEDHASDNASSHISARDEASNPQTSTPRHVLRRVASGLASEENHEPLSEQAPQPMTLQASDNPPTAVGNPRRSTALPNLSIDTQKVPAKSSLMTGRSRSPLSASQHAQLIPANPEPTRSSPTPSSASSRTRHHGFSLRRSLLARNVQGQSEHGTPTVSTAPSSSKPRSLSQAMPETRQNKKDNTSVTVSPVVRDRDHIELRTYSSQSPAMVASLPRYEMWERARTRNATLAKRIMTSYEKCRRFLLRLHEIPPSKNGRQIKASCADHKALIDERTGREYIDNTICSSRYTLWNFLPRQLLAQFSKLANFYFLSVSILQMIPGLSTTGNYTTIVPLTFFVAISMAKEGYDDLRRYKLDKAENLKEAFVARRVPRKGAESPSKPSEPLDWIKTKWKDVRVGDVVRLRRDEAAPADLALLHVDGSNGIAYFETMALDGETNLKSKQASSLTKTCVSVDSLVSCNAQLTVEDPNLDLYKFDGKMITGNQIVPLTNNEIVYRGSVLRNTQESIGMVIYSGEECKIRMNATKNPRIKAPALQSVVNKVVVIIVIFVIALAIFNTVAYQIWVKTTEKKAWYLTDARVAFFPILSSFIILFNTMVPLSLYVSLEIVKACQVYLMNDIEMYDEESNTPMEARTNTINEELGQVNYIFSDKTGTLTNNSMRFRKISIAGTAWLHNTDQEKEADHAAVRHSKSQVGRNKGKKPIRRRKRDSRESDADPPYIHSSVAGNSTKNPVPRTKTVSHDWKKNSDQTTELLTQNLLRYIQSKPHTVFAKKVRFFFLGIALCHTCLPETNKAGEVDFQASSPDEQALVRAAQELGYVVADRQTSTITIKTYPPSAAGEPLLETYQILDVVEFSSTRKRMSIVVRFPDNRICIFCKGADSVILRRLRLQALALEQAAEVEQRVNKRQSLEAQEAMRRDSEQRSRKDTLTRSSFTMQRHSLGGGLPRPSMVSQRLQPIRDGLEDWLKDREVDVDQNPRDDTSLYYSPRPSTTLAAHQFPLSPGVRSSFQIATEEPEDLVEESLVVDDCAVFERCFQHINDFATEGLRTLLYAHRFLDEEEYRCWRKVFHDASTSLVNRQEMIEKAGDMIEQDFELLGATAIEDKLQDGVPESIEKLRRANIKLWMLTGDKRETAINVGHACRLIKDYSAITILDHEIGDVDQRMASATLDIGRGKVAHSVVVVDGHTLGFLEADDTARRLFVELAILADSVICCRASPSQKAWLVRAIRRKVKNAITLAIGDGANDIAMIQEAHVGIGITGKEGLQAARTSDYSIAQFRFLLRLLLVHGRWNYIRTCKYILSTFWKELLFYLTQALFQRYAGYTGTSLYEPWSLSMFNTLFTSLPVIFMGIFEKDLAPSTLLAVPELYTLGHRNGGFNFTIYAGWVFMASAEAMLVYFLMFGLYGQATFTFGSDLFSMGTLTFTACVIIITTKIQFFELHNKSITCAVAMFLSVGAWFLWNLIFSYVYKENVIYDVKKGFLDRFGRNALWWLTLILIITSVWAFEIAVRCLKSMWVESDVEVFQELEKDPLIRQRFEAAASGESRSSPERLSRRPSEWVEESRAEMRDVPRTAEDQQKREVEVQELLNRPRVMFADPGTGAGGGVRRRQHSESEEKDEYRTHVDLKKEDEEDEKDKGHPVSPRERRSFDVHELLRKGFGSVRRSFDVV